jgi:hypothetical protein
VRSQLRVVVVVGRPGAAGGASSRLSVESPKLRFGAAAEIATGSSRSVEKGGLFEAELGLTTTVGDMTEEMTSVVGRPEAAWGASSRLSVDSPKLRLEAAAEIEGSSRRGADEGRVVVELWVAATVGDMTEEKTWVMGAARGATTGE